MSENINVGIIGIKPDESWAAIAHVPAIQYMPNKFTIKGVANSNIESSKSAAEKLNVPLAFASAEELIASPEIDAVTVTITVPQHLEVVKAAVNAGKHIYCEAPLGNGYEEAKTMADLVKDKNIVAVTGLQARVAPEILFLRQMIKDGALGEILSTSITGWGGNWGPALDNVKRLGYLLDKSNGATMLTIPFGHTIAAFRDVLGDITELSAQLDTRISEVTNLDTGGTLKQNAPDQIMVIGTLESGAPLNIHYQGGMPNGIEGFTWDIHGTQADIRVTAAFGHAQMAQLSIFTGKNGSGKLAPVEVPATYKEGIDLDVSVGNVARNYARMASDIKNGTQSASTFADGADVLKLIDAIEKSAQSGTKVRVDAKNRPIPMPK